MPTKKLRRHHLSRPLSVAHEWPQGRRQAQAYDPHSIFILFIGIYISQECGISVFDFFVFCYPVSGILDSFPGHTHKIWLKMIWKSTTLRLERLLMAHLSCFTTRAWCHFSDKWNKKYFYWNIGIKFITNFPVSDVFAIPFPEFEIHFGEIPGTLKVKPIWWPAQEDIRCVLAGEICIIRFLS